MTNTEQNPPLWKTAVAAFLKAGFSDTDGRKGSAAMFCVIADAVVPDCPEPKCYSSPSSLQDAAWGSWARSQAIRRRLLAEADRAKRGEQ